MAPSYIDGTDGNKVTQSKDKKGNIIVSSNAPDDVKKAATLLNKSGIGKEVLEKAINSDVKTTITIDKTTVNNDNGSFKRGNTTSIPDAKDKTKLKEVNIVVYEATIKAQQEYVTNRGEIPVGDKSYKASDLSTDDIVGSDIVHELTHATDPASNSIESPNSTYEEREAKPDENQQKYLDEIINKKPQE
jgi:hypothetical protein